MVGMVVTFATSRGLVSKVYIFKSSQAVVVCIERCNPRQDSNCINIDGLPIYKSKNYSVWPIQAAIVNTNRVFKPFVEAIFWGK